MVDELVTLAQAREHGEAPAEVTVRAWTVKGHLYVENKLSGNHPNYDVIDMVNK
tara:strand:- start:185 stop:346 length:162 start_codon:yes stop_codon:yes gene_type:complete